MAEMTTKKCCDYGKALYLDGENIGRITNCDDPEEIARRYNLVETLQELTQNTFGGMLRTALKPNDQAELLDILLEHITPPAPLTLGRLVPGESVEVTIRTGDYIYTRPHITPVAESGIPENKVLLLRKTDGAITMWDAIEPCRRLEKK